MIPKEKECLQKQIALTESNISSVGLLSEDKNSWVKRRKTSIKHNTENGQNTLGSSWLSWLN